MYTIQKLGATSDGSNGYKSIYGMIVYKRMTETDLEMMKKSYTYDTDIDRSVPDNCKFKIKAYYAEDDKDNTDPVFQTFCLVTFELTDEYGFNSSDTTTIQLLGRVIVVICQIALESWNVRQTV